MYPTEEQKDKLNSYLDSSRFIYNKYSPKKEQMYKEEGKMFLLKDIKKDLVRLQEEYPWLKEENIEI